MMQALQMISSMATRELLAEVVADWQAGGGHPVQATALGGVDVARRLRQGEVFDLVVLARDAIDALCAEGLLRPDRRRDLVRSGIAVAVPAGALRPDISTEQALRQAVLNAPSLGYSSGPSGSYLLKLFEHWGVLDAIRPRFVQPPPGVPVGTLVARGQVALGFQQMSELMYLPGIALLGPLPAPIQSITVFTAAVHGASLQAAAAGPLLDYLAAPLRSACMRRHGMEPA